MSIHVVGLHMEVTNSIQSYAQEKLSRILKYVNEMTSQIHVVLSLQRVKHRAEVTVHVLGHDVHCRAEGQDMYAAIDLLTDKTVRAIRKLKDKYQHHRR